MDYLILQSTPTGNLVIIQVPPLQVWNPKALGYSRPLKNYVEHSRTVFGSPFWEVSTNCYAKLASCQENGALHRGSGFIKESIRAQCHSKQDDEKNGAEIASSPSNSKDLSPLSTFKIGWREEGRRTAWGRMVNLYIPRRQNGGTWISAGNLTFTLAH